MKKPHEHRFIAAKQVIGDFTIVSDQAMCKCGAFIKLKLRI